MSQNYLTIKEASLEFGKSECWIRRMVHQGKLNDIKRVNVGDTKVKRIELSRAELSKRLSSNSRTQRKDGRNKFTLYATPSEIEALTQLLEANEIAVPIARSNPPKS